MKVSPCDQLMKYNDFKTKQICNYFVGEGALKRHGFCAWRPEDNFLTLVLSVCSKNSPLPMLRKAILIKHNESKWSGAWKFEGSTCKEEGRRSGKSSEGSNEWWV